jgi:two-component system, NtrC family, nitrogen regulation sensor histidine kinase GlnL
MITLMSKQLTSNAARSKANGLASGRANGLANGLDSAVANFALATGVQTDLNQPTAQKLAVASAFVEALPLPAIAAEPNGRILLANGAAQDLFLRSASLLERSNLKTILSEDSPVHGLIERAWRGGAVVNAREIMLRGNGFSEVQCDLTASPSEEAGFVALILRPRGRGRDLSERMQDAAGARSMAALGRSLAHEVKNPLAGIRGAAQLLFHDVDDNGRALANLIVEETDRVRRLIDRMESFGDDAPIDFAPINVHTSLERVAALAENGFARALKVKRRFDPSIPEALGDADQLMQVFLNLAKNAAEAAERRDQGGEIVLTTAYRHGVRVRTAGGETRDVPLEIAFHDNGPGVVDDLKDCLFEPFVSTKETGGGLGLPLVQKIVSAHGGVVDFESTPGRTVFRVRLPKSLYRPSEGTDLRP